MIKNNKVISNDELYTNYKPSIFTKKINKNYKVIPYNSILSTLGPTRHFPSSTKEWSNSIYTYNNNSLKNLPVLDKTLIRVIKSYFNLSFKKDYLKVSNSPSKRLNTRFKRLSVSKMFVAKAELKHTNEKVIITLFVHDGEKKSLLRKLNLFMYLARITNNIVRNAINVMAKRESFSFKKKYFQNFAENFSLVSNKISGKSFGVKWLLPIIIKTKKNKSLLNILELDYFANGDTIKKIRRIKKNVVRAIKPLRDAILKLKINQNKFNLYIYRLTPLISRLYGKKVEFNIIKLKYIYLNSDIFTEAIAIKLKDRENKLLKVIRSALFLVKIPRINRVKEKYGKDDRGFTWINQVKNLSLESIFQNKSTQLTQNNYNDVLSEFLTNLLPNNEKPFVHNEDGNIIEGMALSSESSHKLENLVFTNLKHKSMAGVRIEAKGRLTRRFTASRSVFKVRWKGGLRNVESSYRGVSTVILRGHTKSNVQFSRVNSKTRNGAFGVKGWISGK